MNLKRVRGVYAQTSNDEKKAFELARDLQVPFLGTFQNDLEESITGTEPKVFLTAGPGGLALVSDGLRISGDFRNMLRRIRPDRLRSELLVKASGINKEQERCRVRKAVDATAGMGEDAFLLAAAGFFVTMFERDPVIAALLRDAMERALKDEQTAPVVRRMSLEENDSIDSLLKMPDKPDVIFLDPMFPERTKSALVKKKFQLLHVLETPCEEEEKLLRAAMKADPGRILVKRPLKGPWLGQIKPSFSLSGKAVRFDCLLPPYLCTLPVTSVK